MATTTSLVTQVNGQAWVRGADGSRTPLRVGMRVPVNAEIVTSDGASVQLQDDGLPSVTIGGGREVQLGADMLQAQVDPSTAAAGVPANADVARVLAALESGADPFAELDPTAAVLQGGGGDGGSSFTRLAAIIETTRPLGLEYPRPGFDGTEDIILGGMSPGAGDDAAAGGETGGAGVGVGVTPPQVSEPAAPGTGAPDIEAPAPAEPEEPAGPVEPVDPPVDGTDPTEPPLTPEVPEVPEGPGGPVTPPLQVDKVTFDPVEALEGDAGVVVTARVGFPVVGSPLIITLANGAIITIPVGQTEGVSTPFALENLDDVYVDGSEEGVGIREANGGNYASLDTSDSARIIVRDTVDEVKVSIVGDGAVTEAQGAVFTVSVSQVLDRDLTVTLSNGQTVTIPKGATSVKYTMDPQGDDVYADGEVVEVGVTGASVAGATFENLVIDPTLATVQVKDTVDATKLVLNDVIVAEGGQTSITAVVEAPVTGTPLVITLSNGLTITIAIGETEGTSAPFTVDGEPGDSQTISIKGTQGGNYEKLDTSSSATVPIHGARIDLGTDVARVYEDGLNNDSDTRETYEGTFTVRATDGLSSITIAGKTFNFDEIQGKSVDTGVGTLIFSGYAPNSAGTEAQLVYTYTLKKGLDHSKPGPDSLFDNIALSIAGQRGTTATGTLMVEIVDSIPEANDAEHHLSVAVSKVTVGGLESGFVNYTKTSGKGSIVGKNEDSDSYVDVINWGGGSQSGYSFVDNEDLRTGATSLVDKTFMLGRFTHVNYPISSDDATLKSTDLVVKLNVVIDGETHTVNHVIKLLHDETPNTSNAAESRDIVTISDSSLNTTFQVGDRTYEFRIDGFRNSDGSLAKQALTWENASTSFDLFATISSTDDLPSLAGQVEWEIGVDDDDSSVKWENSVIRSDGSQVITNEYGTLTVKPDGTYTFVMSRDARDDFSVDETRDVKFKYTVTDSDGDASDGYVSIVINGEKNLPSRPVLEEPAEAIEVDNVPGETFTGDLGIEVGRDVAGSTVAFLGADRQSLNDKAVTATVKAGGKDFNVELTSGGAKLVYKTNAHGDIEAVRQGTDDVVFRLSGNAAEGTYSVEMVGSVDPIQTVTSPTPKTVVKAVTVTNKVSTADDVTIAISAFLDKGGKANVQDSDDVDAAVVIDHGTHRGISVDNPLRDNAGESESIGNHSQRGSDSDGTHGEKLALDFSSADPSVKVNKVELTLNQFGDRAPDEPTGLFGWGTKRVAEEDTITYAVFEKDSSIAPRVVTIKAASVGKDGSANDATGSRSITIEGNDIVRIVIGAGDTATEFSVDENIKVTYVKNPEIAVDDDSDLTLNLGAKVTDGDGQSASTDLTIVIDNVESELPAPAEHSMSEDGIALLALGDEGEFHIGGTPDDPVGGTDGVNDSARIDTPVVQANGAEGSESAGEQGDSDTLASLLPDDSEAILLEADVDLAAADEGEGTDASANVIVGEAAATTDADEPADETPDFTAELFGTGDDDSSDTIDVADILDLGGDEGSVDSILGATEDDAGSAQSESGGAPVSAGGSIADASGDHSSDIMRSVAQQVVQQAQNSDVS